MGQCLLCGWTEQQFWFSTYRAVFNLVIARQKDEDNKARRSWEQTRAICEFVFKPYRKKNDLTKVFELPWDFVDQDKKGRILTPEEIEEKFSKRDALVRKKFQNAK